jgi:dihydrofolate synthase/folylpolyglutamate synthase
MAKTKKTTKKTKAKKVTKASSKLSVVKSKKAFTTYEQALEYLFARTDYEKHTKLRYNVSTFNLDRMNNLLSLLGNPHKKIHTVHIAGTKGKGSTANMLARMLESNNYKVGLYTSPHFVHLHERIMINSVMISEEQMVNLLNRCYAPIEKLAKTDAPTFFEIMTALAFLHFADEKVDFAIIETGMGGRLDSTNVITPEIVGVTSLSIDHQDQLGRTIDLIAKEKAGIFKKGIPVVTVQQHPDAMRVLKSQALETNSPLSVTGGDIDFSYRFETSREFGPHTRICLTTANSKFEHLKVPLHGKHQAVNCGLALAMLDKLKENGFKIDNEKAATGLQTVSLIGRMEMICNDPRIMIDAAHNAASIKAVIHAIGQNIPYDSMVVIFGCNADKDIDGMLDKLQYGADKVIFTRSNSPKAVLPQELADKYTEICGKMCQSASSLGEALKIAKSAVGREDLILITGSIYLIGQAKQRFQVN